MNSRFKIGCQWSIPCLVVFLALLTVTSGKFELPILTFDTRQVQALSLIPGEHIGIGVADRGGGMETHTNLYYSDGLSIPGYQIIGRQESPVRTPALTGNNSSADTTASTLLHYWLFDSTIPNDTPLEILGASYSALSDADVYIEFESALAGYPFDEEHPDWRRASMERRNAPTEINYRPEGNEGIPFRDANMRGIQIKQPFTNADYDDTLLFDRQNTLIIYLPTTGYRDVVLQFAAKDEGAADTLCFDYATSIDSALWLTDTISNTVPLAADYQLYTLDFTGVEAVNDNPAFRIRIRFAGVDMVADEGNRVTFNNISLTGLMDGPLPLYRVYLPMVLRNHPWVVLNEYMASNGVTLEDEDGDSSDWIELYNNSTTAVNLTGFGLSDDPGVPFRWTFPAVELGPQSHLLVWASGKNRAQPGQPLHTNFSISADGESLLLTHPGGWTVDQVGPVTLPRDISYGRQPNGTGAWVFFDQPTPGYGNNTLGYGTLLDPPTFSHIGGFFPEAFYLTLSHPEPGVRIIYTLDGSIPDPQNMAGRTYTYKNQYPENPGNPFGQLLLGTYQTYLYTQPLAIVDRTTAPDRLTGKSSTYERNPTYFPQTPVFKGTVVRAQAIQDWAMPSPVQTHTFFVTPEGRKRYSLPVVALSMQEDTLFGYDEGIYTAGVDFDAWRMKSPSEASGWYVPANWRRDTEFEGYLELLEPNDSAVVFNQAMGFRIHGGASRILRLKTLRLYARNDYGESDFAYPFFPDQPYTRYRRLILRNSGNDLGSTMFRDAMIHMSVAHLNFDTQAYRPVVVFLNGEYWGIHNLRERYDQHYLARVYGVDPDNVDLLTGNGYVVEGSAAHYEAMLNYIRTHDLAKPEHYRYIQTQMDVDNFMDYQIAQIYAANTNWPSDNIKFWRLKTKTYEPNSPYGHDGRWRWLLYDTDVGFGLRNGAIASEHDTLAYATQADSTVGNNPDWSTFLLRKLLTNQEFRYNFINRFADLLNTAFLPERMTTIIQTLQQGIAPEMPEHIARWRVPGSMSNWNNQVNVLIAYANQRPIYQRQHISDKFGLPGKFTLTVNVAHPEHGYVRVNTIDLLPSTPGVTVVPYQPRVSGGLSRLVGSTPVVVSSQQEPVLLHYWLFDTTLSNDTPLETISTTYSVLASAAPQIEFKSSLAGYPFHSDHPDWRRASLERRNAPTDINYRPEGNDAIPYNNADMRGIQVKQPFIGNGGENTLIFHLPTTGYRDVVFRFAAKDEGAAESLIFDYATGSGENNWVADNISTTASLAADYQLYTLDFTGIEAADDNLDFRIRIRFDGSDMDVDDGDRVTFNNISLDGIASTSNGSYRVFLPLVHRAPPPLLTPYPWAGVYFRDIPIKLEAIPLPGYRFVGWKELPEGTPARTVQTFTGNVTLTALFETVP